MAGTIFGRVKATQGTKGGPLTYTRRDGSKGEAQRVTVATVFADEQGRLSLSFEPDQKAAVLRSFGLPADAKLYFDLYTEDSASAKRKPAADDGEDF